MNSVRTMMRGEYAGMTWTIGGSSRFGGIERDAHRGGVPARAVDSFRYIGPSSSVRRPVTPRMPGPVCVPMTGPISEISSGSRP